MSDYYNVTTNNGDAAIATAIANNTKLNITHIAFGDGNGAVPTPNKARTTLVNEVYRQVIAKYEPHPTIANYLIVEVVIPSEIGGFYIREIGLIADGILISHGSHAPFYKVAEPNGVSEFHLKYTINIQDGGVVDLILDESLIYATEGWVDENYVPRDEIVDNLTTDDPLKPVSAKQAKVLQENKLGKTENAVSASKLSLARNIALSGDISGNADFDGSGNINILASMGAKLLNTTGYKIIGDIVLQWGAISAQNNSTVVATLPIAVGSILQAVCTYDFPNAVEYPLIAVGSFTQTSLTIGVKAANSNYYYIRWIAICKKA